MEEIKVSFDRDGLGSKPSGKEIGSISNRIGSSVKQLDFKHQDLKNLAVKIGAEGHTFCPATFKGGKRSKENFEQQQFFALDFDNKDADRKISFEEVKKRADKYGLPVLFAYDTFSSTEHDKFRVVFLNDAAICHRAVAEAMQLAIGEVFPESDSSCYKDVSKMYFGGQKLVYFNEECTTINVESLFRNLTYYMKDRYKMNHYKGRLSLFSRKSGIALKGNGFLDVTVSDDPTESHGVSSSDRNGKNVTSPIIYTDIIANVTIFPKLYRIGMTDDTRNSSVGRTAASRTTDNKGRHTYATYRSSTLQKARSYCRLFREFEDGARDMGHHELFGLATNLIHVETGIRCFQSIQNTHLNMYSDERSRKWLFDLNYMSQQEYKPQHCDHFCPYKSECNHGKNILSTVSPKRGMMEKLPNYHEEFCSLKDMQDDTYRAIYKAYRAQDTNIHIIKAMTGAGKSHSFLQLMAQNPDSRLLIAASTTLLKDELYNKAKQMGLNVCKTPSLDQIRGEMPQEVWKHIQRLRNSGRHSEVHPYIQQVVSKKHIPALGKYMKAREKLKTFDGSIITTHRYFLSIDEKHLNKFTCIIDEDILFKSIISNQGEITISELKKLRKKSTDIHLRKKIKHLLDMAETQSCIELNGFEYDASDADKDNSMIFDISAFCAAKYFYVRRSSKEQHLKEDTISFLKPASFHDMKLIIVSATVNEGICRDYFGADKVDFYECKKAEYQGTLKQYPRKSMSRTCVANNPGIIHRLMGQLNIDSSKVITFMRESIGNLHFGNTEGSNTLEGQDILVVGTPYHADFLYKLVAFSMGMEFDEDEEMEPQVLTHNGYRFRFTTFKNEDLRAIQFWMIESELEQAVGRARLLRNSCEVHLFSNFPLSQAQMVDGFDYSKE